MKNRSIGEWIAITLAVVLGFSLFLLGFFFFGVQGARQENSDSFDGGRDSGVEEEEVQE